MQQPLMEKYVQTQPVETWVWAREIESLAFQVKLCTPNAKTSYILPRKYEEPDIATTPTTYPISTRLRFIRAERQKPRLPGARFPNASRS